MFGFGTAKEGGGSKILKFKQTSYVHGLKDCIIPSLTTHNPYNLSKGNQARNAYHIMGSSQLSNQMVQPSRLGAGRKAGEICFKYSKVFQTYSSLTYVQFANKIKLIKCGNDNFAVEKMKKI